MPIDGFSTRFILIQTSHAGNVGATARAMRVMGFDDLVLVEPRWPDVLQRPEAVERASGATDVLEKARIVATLPEALDGVTDLCATAMTPRDFGPPTAAPRAHFEALAAQARAQAEAARQAGLAPAPRRLGILFGSERYGMRNEDVYRSHACLRIPTAPDYGSLNIAAAVQLIAYEWRQALGGFAAATGEAGSAPAGAPADRLADGQQLAGLLDHWARALAEIGFLDPAAPKKLMPRLNQLFNRAAVTEPEVHILRGIAKAMSEAARGKREAEVKGASIPAAGRASAPLAPRGRGAGGEGAAARD
ncbi:MAG: RNA methyltransferase [Comamonas sp.]